MRLMRVADAPDVPWKNGGGTTRELLTQSSEASAFGWRVSVAMVEKDGPFSIFPGVDRTLVGLSGHGKLRIGDRIEWIAPGSAVHFAGDKTAVVTVDHGPITALNIMSERGAWTHQIHPPSSPAEAPAMADPVRLYATLSAGSRWRLQPGDLLLDVREDDALDGLDILELRFSRCAQDPSLF